MSKFKLNKQQYEAITYITGPCLVLAGAGSGKTRVITEKIVHLIKNCQYTPYNICALTFTNKAAKEMKERISCEFPPNQIFGLRVSTFHSLCLDILREEYQHIGLKKQFIIFDDYDQFALMKEILLEISPNLDKTKLAEESKNYLKRISNCKNELISPSDIQYLNIADKVEFSNIYDKYNTTLQIYNAIDFDDIILKTTNLFKTNNIILSKWQKRIKYLLVDEYQDTNLAQYELIKLIIKQHENFTVVGDDDQSIYSWRGARPENIQILSHDFSNLKVIMLEQNYRSKGRILKCANALISNNNHLYLKKLYSELNYGDYIHVLIGKNPNDEANKVIVNILATKIEKNAKNKDFAILYRSNYQSREIEEHLQRAHVPYRVIGGSSFFALPEIKDIMNYLRLIAFDDNAAFLQIINIPARGIGSKTLEHFTEYAQTIKSDYLPATTSYEIFSHLSNKEADKLYNFGNMIYTLRNELSGDNYLDKIFQIPDIIGYTDWVTNHSNSEKASAKILQNINSLLEWLKNSLEGNSKNSDEKLTFEKAIDKLSIREMLDRNEQDYELDEITLMTLHASKGLEFNYVYLIGMEEGILPHSKAIADDEKFIHEERRLAYVGITRAREQLTLSYCKNRNTKDIKTNTLSHLNIKPSRFIAELPQEDLLIEGEKNEKQKIADEIKKESIIKSLDELFNSKIN